MARLALLAAIAVAATAAVVLAGAGNHRVFMEEMRGMAHGWSRGARADPNTKLHLTVAVKQTNTDVLEATLIRISDPEHPDFNKLMSDKEVHALVAPRPESIAAVKKWMHVYGIEESQMTFSPNSDFISAVVTVATAEKMLETEYYTFHHKSGKTMTRVNKYTLPAYVASEVDFVAPTVRLPVVQAVRPANRPEDDDFGSVTPSFLRTLYGVGSYSASASGNRQSCSSFLEQYYAPSDLQSFFQQYDPEANGRTPTVTGPNDSTNPGTEASLDIQYIMAMGNNVPTTFWSTPGTQPNNPENEPFLVWLQNVDATADAQVPWTFSVSYGDNENTVNFAYAVRVNTEFQKAGVRGISIMFSSGDGGVAGGQTTDCTVFIPTFPAGSPWVTSVGGTTSSGPETAASFSSGGFSNYWARPSWQVDAVAQYFKVAQNLPASNLYNQTGAGIPDVSAQAEGFMVYQGGFAQPVDGTSCSSPTFTGIMSLINDQRMKAGKKPLGYLNQIFYKNPDVFTDITTGNNPGCNTNGFQAAAGWDPVTGLGTPNFSKLTQLALSLP